MIVVNVMDGADYECWDGSVVYDSSDDAPDVEVSYLDITYSSDTDIAGFQFDMEGVNCFRCFRWRC